MKELTAKQSEPLFALVKYQREKEVDVVFSRLHDDIYDKDDTKQTPIAKADNVTVARWCKYDYADMEPWSTFKSRYGGEPTIFELRLTKKAISHEWRSRQPKPVQLGFDLWEVLASDIRATIAGAVGGTIAGVLTFFILKWLNY